MRASNPSIPIMNVQRVHVFEDTEYTKAVVTLLYSSS